MYDLIIMGAGPGGYVLAERAGHLGKNVLLIEKANLGGVCLNWGCIPTKTLLHCAKQFVHAKEAAAYGVMTGDVTFDFSKAMQWKQDVIKTLQAGIGFQMKKNHVTVVEGEAQLVAAGRVRVGEEIYEGEQVVIATGSSPIVPPIPGADLPHVLTSTELLELEELPKSLVVIGGGVIGVEFASLFSSLGVAVELIEQRDEIIPFMDKDQAVLLRRAMRRAGVKFNLSSEVTSIDGNVVQFTDAKGNAKAVEADCVLMSVGRAPNVAGLGLEEAGVAFDRNGIQTDDQQRTSLPNVFAIGDVTGKSQLAHSASRMGDVVANTLWGEPDQFNARTIPWAVYSFPEVAGCGWTEADAIEAGYTVTSATLPLTMSGRFIAENGKRGPGAVTVVKDVETDKVLGIHMLGAGVSEIICSAAIILESGLTVAEMKRTVFPHPTVGEVLRDVMFQL